MASTNTAIEWTDRTWNPTTGCNKVSPGCKFCYAEGVAKRFTNHFPDGFDFVMKPERLDQPRRWRKPSRVFVDSMSDLFHEEMPLEFLQAIFKVMAECPQHGRVELNLQRGLRCPLCDAPTPQLLQGDELELDELELEGEVNP